MWRYIPGAKEPAQKRKLDADEKRKQDRAYDQGKRQRLFQDKWKQEFEWLEYKHSSMFCTICQKYSLDSKSKFISEGCTNFKHETLIKHSTSDGHIKAVTIESTKKLIPGSAPAELMIKNMNEATFSKLMILFRTCHALAKHGRPFTDFVWQCDLLSSNGLNVGITYRNDKSAQVFIHHIAETERQEMANDLKEAYFFCIVCDSATDSAIVEEEIVFVRYVKQGVMRTQFVGLQSVERGDAVSIEKAIEDCIQQKLGLEKCQWIKKLVGFGSDGAAVMVGHKGGVIAKLKSAQPCVVGIHCFNHRLELAYHSACKNVPLYLKVEKLLIGLYYFYHNSPLNRSMLKRSYKALEVPPLMPTRVGGTHWLPHTMRALGNLINGYSAFEMHLQQLKDAGSGDSCAKAKGYRTLMKNPDVKLFCCFLLVVVTCLSKVSLTLQENYSTVSDIHVSLESATQTLEKYKSRSGIHLREAISEDYVPSSIFENGKVSLLLGLKESLTKRFEDIHKDVLKASQIANLSQWPQQFVEDFGDESVVCLVDHYKPVFTAAGVNTGLIDMEWTELKHKIYQWSIPAGKLTWPEINGRFRASCPNILDVIDLIRSLPASSSQCERGFSLMKGVKNDWRSRLRADRVSDLLTIIMHTPPVGEYDPTRAIHLWNKSGSRSRRPQFKLCSKKRVTEVETGDVSADTDSDASDNESGSDHMSEDDYFTIEDEVTVCIDDDEPTASCSSHL